jgi:hypothetical protein
MQGVWQGTRTDEKACKARKEMNDCGKERGK